MLEPREIIRFPPSQRPILLVVVDTEEEFDWRGGFDRSATSVRAMGRIDRFQRVCDEFSVRPTYVIDYPVATQRDGVEPLREILEEGRACLGAHLHPWVNPPHEETVTARLTYPGNLDADLEGRKLRHLSEAIEGSFGVRPRIYKAGRYGIGPNTAAILEREGYDIDLSVCPRVDLGEDGGPDFTRFAPDPFWFGQGRRLLEIPVTAGFVGYLNLAGSFLDRLSRHPALRWARLPGILSRSGALERVRLSPEGVSTEEHRRLTRSLLARGIRTFTFSFHSPSVEPGCTPYVRSGEDLRLFLDRCRAYFKFFLGDLGGVALTPVEVRDLLARGGS